MYKLILLLGICSAFAVGSKLPVTENGSEKIVGCYYENPGRMGMGDSLTIENINMSLCSHLFYFSASISTDASIRILSPENELNDNGFKRITSLRKKKNLKTLVSMIEVLPEDDKKILTGLNLREKLASNLVDFVKKYDFDGIELNLLGPEEKRRLASDKKNFVLILKTIREKFDKEGFILSLFSEGSVEIAENYDIKGISKYLNFISLETFDFQGDNDKSNSVGNNSPIYPSSKESAEDCKFNIDSMVKYWISKGAPPSKLILGTAFHGSSYTSADPKETGIGAPLYGSSKLGSPSLPYSVICSYEKSPRWKHVYDEEQQASSIYQGTQFISYDDIQSIKKKAEYANKMNLGGVWASDIAEDDYKGNCGEKFPLLKALNTVLRDKC